MDDRSLEDTDAHLALLIREILALDEVLLDEGLSACAYYEKWTKLHKLKEAYKAFTGIYPMIPARPKEPNSQGES